MESYYLQRTREYWILWIKRYDDNYGRWDAAVAIARCPRNELGEDDKHAAMVLLAAAFAEDMRKYDNESDRFHGVTNTGLLSMEELDAVANTVWDGSGE